MSKRKIQSLKNQTLGEINLKYVQIRFVVCFPVYLKFMHKSEKSRKEKSLSNYNKPIEIIENAKYAIIIKVMIRIYR